MTAAEANFTQAEEGIARWQFQFSAAQENCVRLQHLQHLQGWPRWKGVTQNNRNDIDRNGRDMGHRFQRQRLYLAGTRTTCNAQVHVQVYSWPPQLPDMWLSNAMPVAADWAAQSAHSPQRAQPHLRTVKQLIPLLPSCTVLCVQSALSS